MTERHGAPARAALPVIFHFDGIGFATLEFHFRDDLLAHIGIVAVIDDHFIVEVEFAPADTFKAE